MDQQGTFWLGEFGFVFDHHLALGLLVEVKNIEELDLGHMLESSGKLPPLGKAPVASWLLARLFQVTGERLGYLETTASIANDGGGYYLNFWALTRESCPAAYLRLHGNSAATRLWGSCAAEVSSENVVQSFADALLQDPGALMVCRMVAEDSDPPDLDERRLGSPHVFGWDGKSFLGYRRKRRAAKAARKDAHTPTPAHDEHDWNEFVAAHNSASVGLSAEWSWFVDSDPKTWISRMQRDRAMAVRGAVAVVETLLLPEWQRKYPRDTAPLRAVEAARQNVVDVDDGLRKHARALAKACTESRSRSFGFLHRIAEAARAVANTAGAADDTAAFAAVSEALAKTEEHLVYQNSPAGVHKKEKLVRRRMLRCLAQAATT